MRLIDGLNTAQRVVIVVAIGIALAASGLVNHSPVHPASTRPPHGLIFLSVAMLLARTGTLAAKARRAAASRSCQLAVS